MDSATIAAAAAAATAVDTTAADNADPTPINKKSTNKQYPCPIDGCESRVQALSNHLRKVHDLPKQTAWTTSQLHRAAVNKERKCKRRRPEKRPSVVSAIMKQFQQFLPETERNKAYIVRNLQKYEAHLMGLRKAKKDDRAEDVTAKEVCDGSNFKSFLELLEVSLSMRAATISKYVQHVKKYATFLMHGTALRDADVSAYEQARFFVESLEVHLSRFNKAAHRDRIAKCHQDLLCNEQITSADIQATLDNPIITDEVRALIDAKDTCRDFDTYHALLRYIVCAIQIEQLKRPGSIANVRIAEYQAKKRAVGSNYDVIYVRDHKTGNCNPCTIVLSHDSLLAKAIEHYVTMVRPLVACETDRLFVNHAGERLQNLQKYLYELSDVKGSARFTSRDIRKASATLAKAVGSTEQQMHIAGQQDHSIDMQRKHYERRTAVVAITEFETHGTLLRLQQPTLPQTSTTTNTQQQQQQQKSTTAALPPPLPPSTSSASNTQQTTTTALPLPPQPPPSTSTHKGKKSTEFRDLFQKFPVAIDSEVPDSTVFEGDRARRMRFYDQFTRRRNEIRLKYAWDKFDGNPTEADVEQLFAQQGWRYDGPKICQIMRVLHLRYCS